MSNAYFAFRQFGIRQDRCGMKVSTDACIFGAWIPLPQQSNLRILDIGAGTGLLSLMLAQRASPAIIDAIEIDDAAAIQAKENIDDSIFRDRIRLVHGDARMFHAEQRYDLIVSNPPFFSRSLQGPDKARNGARHDDGLNLTALFAIVTRTLREGGNFALLMPFDAEKSVFRAAETASLHPAQRLDILEHPHSRPKRSGWVFRGLPDAGSLLVDRCVIREGQGYAPGFRELLRPFYLRL